LGHVVVEHTLVVTLGSEVAPLEGGLVCDIAVPLRPHTRPATKS